ncbi:AAA family ATPase [Chroococcidiopsis sp. FACHB-1243]|uniref:nSTAND1 domain-containing NTPase n=1 Tax=Chroococcidiopsis sp. [FACHB-1243] TaxID=2692781 RepID=UPI00177E2266|nr:caspase family protein [Chroococcidiopsis sp. [FACHB-1243]]MBD2309765.1 AAA family ATPase [Chroococcidiopsis sp. [FACHB-1243]]
MALEWAAQVIGIKDYPNYTTLSPLTATAEDAEKIAAQLEQYGYRTFRVQRLPETLNRKGESKIDPQGMVNMKELREAIANLFNPPQPNPLPETALFFFSGHGWHQTINGKKEVFLATSDALPERNIYGISLSWLGKQLQISPVKRVIVWLDCCYSGELLGYIPTDKDYCLITATRSYETGVEIPHEQGLLTQALLEGLNPENDPDRIVTSHKLADYIEKRMAQTSQRPLIANSQRAILLTTGLPKNSFQDKCPYRSLSYFSEKIEDAEVFYGREALTKQLIQKVGYKQRLITVLGASGSGKSSLLRAGLLYGLRLGQEIPGSDRWIYITPFTPKETPLKNLLAAFSRSFPDLSLSQDATVNIFYLTVEKLKVLNTPTVLIIDQFEECFTMCDESKQKEFFKYLRQLIDSVDTICILIGMRSDFRARLREYPQVAEKIDKHFVVEHLNSQEIEAAITKPADLVGIGIEGELKRKLIDDVEDYPGSLPLLQYTLTELWRESRQQGEEFLYLKTYESLGGIEGTLQKRADEIYNSLLAEEKTVARRIFLELTQMGETTDTRRRARLHEMANSHHSLELLQQVSEKLADKDARLITKTDDDESHDVILDVVHEALLRHWTQLNEWKREYQNAIATERRIEAAAQEWQENERKPEYLFQETRLGLAEEYLNNYGRLGMLDGLAEEYIEESQKLRDRRLQEKNQRQQLAQAEEKARQEAEQKVEQEREALQAARTRNKVTLFSLIGMLGLASFALSQWNAAQKNAINALAKTSEASLLSNGQLDALVPAVKAGRELENPILLLEADVKQTVSAALQQAIYNVQERNRLVAQAISVSFSLDGKMVASGNWDNTVKLWNAATGKEIKTLKGHQKAVVGVSFSPDGKTIASASWDKTVKLWDIATGKEIKPLKGHEEPIIGVSFSPDGKKIVSASADKTVKLWDIATGKEIKTLKGHRNTVTDVKFSPDSKMVASASADKTVKLWDVATGTEINTLSGHSAEVRSVFFSPDGKMVASASADKTVKLWNVITGKETAALSGHSDVVNSVFFSPDGKTIASASADKTVKLWDIATGTEINTFSGHNAPVDSVSFNEDGSTLASAASADNTVKLWDVGKGQAIKTLREHSAVRSVVFSQDGKTIAFASADNTVKLWDVATGKVTTLSGHSAEVRSVVFSPDGKTIASASADNTVKLWDVATGKVTTLSGHSAEVRSVVFSPDGKTIASASVDNTVKLWDVATGKVTTLKGHEEPVIGVSFSPDGKTIASASADKTVKLWDVATGTEINTLEGHSKTVYSVSFSPDGKTIASASWDTTVKLWNVATGKVTTLSGHSAEVNSVVFSPDGKTIASASWDTTVKLWDVATGKVTTLSGHSAEVRSVVFSPDGKTIASASADSTVKLWELYLNSNINELMTRNCNWLRDYLQTNTRVSNSDRHLCDGIGTSIPPGS